MNRWYAFEWLFRKAFAFPFLLLAGMLASWRYWLAEDIGDIGDLINPHPEMAVYIYERSNCVR